ncbi:hypothetical protein PNOK_0228800 [Pyrrhoderma noxium]|uniref:U three protein 23 n=1 Tax=Pyrrhoderma noxium TaxID=2282107 RepID=A0A286URX4_9AGAM|nr:hypothetical protein PNOK_0228800 [Pyrrhoderma noxium]
MNFGFRQPYQVLVDSEICNEAVSSKLDFPKQLATVLQGTVKPMITQCSIHTLYLAGKDLQPVVDLAKTFERRRCNHREAIPEEDCIKDVIGKTNVHRYVLAAQSGSLRQFARQVPGTPIVHMKRSVMVLEPVSDATERAKGKMENDRMGPSKSESEKFASNLAKATSTDATTSNTPDSPPKKKRKGPKGPNPLSVKKKKVKDDGRRPPTAKCQVDKKGGDSSKGESQSGKVEVEVGQKRERPEGDEDKKREVNNDQSNGAEETELGARSRKRPRHRNRKRKTQETGESNNTADADEDED